ncbi:DNA mismatch repair protein MSH4 [Marchantia polymorpha subsp. ruderalis]|uniref:DNA mismatch repair protein MutS core domain-containing protein n=2 Tax=Marchantia polymorpha TaxID=3197 RepID=A0AAF6ARI0_MARPO|nr:hypothetical protein MARPO_0001s0167 [Marchantia polymorpha]BBM99050.1 hypothetical protein Mp_1g18290 [Marchantia polymorpha subsp. ruderalis]|eukprot:PTQ50126.1 hypothetical protein MARPO_0001s0167 [Marchantia polymorpha]
MESEKSDSDTRYVLGIIENRVKEVGVAALDLRRASLHLSQFIETSRSYQNIVTLLQYFDPKVIIIPSNSSAPDGMIGLTALLERCSNARKVELVRGFFDDTKGATMLQNVAAKETRAIFSENYHKQFYLCLGAAAAVLKWIEVEHGFIITKNSLQITFNGSFDHMSIDATSIENLEVIEPLVLDSIKQKRNRSSLYNMLNTTKTVGGARLLRANLLQPLKDIETITTRLDSLDELTNNEQLFFGLSDVIQKFPKDTDRVLCSFCFRQKKGSVDTTASTRRSQVLVAAIILLKEALDLLPLLSKVLQDAKSSLLCNIRASLSSNSAYSVLKERISEVISDDAMHARSAFTARTQQCFAVKYGVDCMLDLARKSFCTTSEAIHELGIKYQKEFDMPKLRLVYNQRQGFHIVISESDLQQNCLPNVFLQVVKRGKNFCCSTDELMSLNSRNQEAAAECYVRTEQCLEDLINYISGDVRSLALLAESLSLLDMMVNSFANTIITKLPAVYTRPDFTENGPIAIEAGRHPLLESIQFEDFVPNNTFMSEATNLVIITGPNMSGKSTHLRQVALITIMAHIGCYVPAGFASFRIVDHIFTRIGTGDNLELNASTVTYISIKS